MPKGKKCFLVLFLKILIGDAVELKGILIGDVADLKVFLKRDTFNDIFVTKGVPF